MTTQDQETERRAVKRYSLTMDGRRWEQLTRRAKALNTSNSALINQLVEVYLNGPTALPATGTATAAANPLTSEAGMNMIGATYTDILNRLTTISRKVDEIRSDTALTNDILQDDGGKVDQISRDVSIVAASFKRYRQQEQSQQRRPVQPGQPTRQGQPRRPAQGQRLTANRPAPEIGVQLPPPTPGGLTFAQTTTNAVIASNTEAISAYVPYDDLDKIAPVDATANYSAMSKRERVRELVGSNANNGSASLFIKPGLPE